MFEIISLTALLMCVRDGDAFQQPEIFEFDHVHMDSTAGSPTAVLYGALGTDCFRKFHLVLVDATKQVLHITFL